MWRRMGLVLACLAVGTAVAAADADKAGAGGKQQARKPMRMNEPMSTGMMKPGMKKGEVKRGAERKAREMQPAMEREQESMPPAKP